MTRSRSTISGSARFLDFEAHRIAFAAVVQLGANGFEQRARLFFLEVEIAVARDAEGGLGENFVAAVHAGGIVLDQVLQKDEVVGACRSKAAQQSEAGRAAR